MESAYNIDGKTFTAEPVLIVRFVPNAKRTQNFTHIPGRAQPDSLRGHLSYSSVLQKAPIEVAFAKLCKIPSTLQPLPSSRISLSDHLCPNCWNSSSEQDKDSSGQRCFSKNHWLGKFSLCQQPKTLSQTGHAQNNPANQEGSRFFKAKGVLSSQAPQ